MDQYETCFITQVSRKGDSSHKEQDKNFGKALLKIYFVFILYC